AAPQRAGGLDRRERLRAGGRHRSRGARADGHQALRRLLRRAGRREHGGLHPRRREDRRRDPREPRALLGHRRPCLRLRAHGGGWWSGCGPRRPPPPCARRRRQRRRQPTRRGRGPRRTPPPTAAHAYVYAHMEEAGGVVHTHSTYATAWAARGEEIPCVLTMMGDEFGGPVPIGPFAIIGDDSIGRGIVETLEGHRSPAVLMQNHGPFTIGKDARAAVKAAVMVEGVARTVHSSRQLGEPLPIAQEHIDSLYDRYQNVYGQHDQKG